MFYTVLLSNTYSPTQQTAACFPSPAHSSYFLQARWHFMQMAGAQRGLTAVALCNMTAYTEDNQKNHHGRASRANALAVESTFCAWSTGFQQHGKLVPYSNHRGCRAFSAGTECISHRYISTSGRQEPSVVPKIGRASWFLRCNMDGFVISIRCGKHTSLYLEHTTVKLQHKYADEAAVVCRVHCEYGHSVLGCALLDIFL